MILAIDFNGTLHDRAHPVPGHKMGEPMEGAHEAMWNLNSQGHKLIIHSDMAATAKGIKTIEDWMEYYNIPYDEIAYGKPRADWYVDDKAISFRSWKQVMKDLDGKSTT